MPSGGLAGGDYGKCSRRACQIAIVIGVYDRAAEHSRGAPMKLHWSPRSPFVRKVMIVAHERGLVDRLICVRTIAATAKPHPELMKDNPLSKIPTLVLDDGTALYDSPVICEYLDAVDGTPKLFPQQGKPRMLA